MDALLESVEVQALRRHHDDLAVEHDARRGQRPEGVQQLREIAGHRSRPPAHKLDVSAVAMDESTEAVPLGLVLPAVGGRQLGLDLGQHRLQLEGDGRRHATRNLTLGLG